MRCFTDLPQSGYVTAAWVKARYSISNSTMYLWIANRTMPPPHRIGPRAMRFDVNDLRDFERSFAKRDDEQ